VSLAWRKGIASIYGISDDLLLHDAMKEEWEKFVDAFSSVAVRYEGGVNLSLLEVELEGEVADAFIGALLLKKNCDGWKFASNALKIEMNDDAVAATKTLLKHPNFNVLVFERCGIGRSIPYVSCHSRISKICQLN
jgi:hypothetical protein